MSPLSFILIIASFLFLFFAIDGMQRRKFSFLHFFVFVWGSILILSFVFIPWFQQWLSDKIWVARWSDVIVYGALMTLWYFYFEVLNAVTKEKNQTSRLITAEAILNRTVYGQISNDNIIKKDTSINHTDKDSFLFLIRAYNEWVSLWWVIDEVVNAWFSKIIVVNDGSRDNTSSVVAEKWMQYKDIATITLLSHLINRWWWAANKTWFEFAQQYIIHLRATWLVTYDADGQMIIDDMNVFIANMQEAKNNNIKVYLWTRFAPGWSSDNMPIMRRIILWWSKVVTLFFNRLNVSDPHNGYRVLHKSILHDIHITSDGMMYASELLDSIRVHTIPFIEVPVNIKYTEYSLSKGQKNRNALKILAELIYKKIFYK